MRNSHDASIALSPPLPVRSPLPSGGPASGRNLRPPRKQILPRRPAPQPPRRPVRPSRSQPPRPELPSDSVLRPPRRPRAMPGPRLWLPWQRLRRRILSPTAFAWSRAQRRRLTPSTWFSNPRHLKGARASWAVHRCIFRVSSTRRRKPAQSMANAASGTRWIRQTMPTALQPGHRPPNIARRTVLLWCPHRRRFRRLTQPSRVFRRARTSRPIWTQNPPKLRTSRADRMTQRP